MSDYERKFGGLARLYGQEGLERLRQANVCVVGIGGVGSWAVEALARSGVGHLTLIDLDMVAESNTNRQVHATDGIFGRAKVDAMGDRIHSINPDCKVVKIEEFVAESNLEQYLHTDFDGIIDAIDQVSVKTLMVAHCRSRRIPLTVSGAAGGKVDPSKIAISDLARTTQDPLLSKVRSQLRRHHGFPKGDKSKFGISAVYSTEPVRYPPREATCEVEGRLSGLNCAGFGSLVSITASFGLAAAALIINQITHTPP